ncbi:MAG: galactose-1-phosphate uridylyltransferase [Acidimicrobiales bacterium]
MNQLRLDPLTGRWVTVATHRAALPDAFAPDGGHVEIAAGESCPFCPGHEGELPPPTMEADGPDGDWRLRVVPNRFPAFRGEAAMEVERLGPLFARADATGVHEVLVLSPNHEHSWADLDDDGAASAMTAARDRLAAHAALPGVRYSQAVVNHGRAAGASLRHPHGQLLGIAFVPGELLDEIAGFRRFVGGCLLCATVEAERSAGHRMVVDQASAVVIAPWWSASPFELLVIPADHHGHLTDQPDDDLAAIGRIIRDVLRRLRAELGDVSYNLVLHTLPHRAPDPFHWHIHVVPRLRSVDGFEQGTGVPVNIVAPEEAAAVLAAD